jgi:hypothetical protein
LLDKQITEATAVMQQAMSLGEELFSRYMRNNPGALAYTADSLDPLADQVDMTFREMPLQQ